MTVDSLLILIASNSIEISKYLTTICPAIKSRGIECSFSDLNNPGIIISAPCKIGTIAPESTYSEGSSPGSTY